MIRLRVLTTNVINRVNNRSRFRFFLIEKRSLSVVSFTRWSTWSFSGCRYIDSYSHDTMKHREEAKTVIDRLNDVAKVSSHRFLSSVVYSPS
jgi:hypothetical protein